MRPALWMLTLLHSAAFAAEPLPPGMTGTFVQVDEAEVRARLAAAVDRAAAQVIFFKRPIARSRLRKAARVTPRVTIVQTAAGRIGVKTGPDVFEASEGAPAVSVVSAQGETIQLMHRLRSNHLEQVLAAGDGVRTNRFIIEGENLVWRVEIRSPELEAPLTVDLKYARVR